MKEIRISHAFYGLRGAVVVAILLACGVSSAQVVDNRISAVLQGLDKVTARISTFTAPLNETVQFGTLRIVARACQKKPPEETPESAAFLEIHDEKPGAEPVSLFSGWMFASSPALSALEHPVYDVWVIDCAQSEPEPPPADAAGSQKPG